MNVRLFNNIHGLAGNAALDAIMRFSAQYLLIAVFAVLALLMLARLRTDGLRTAVLDGLWPAAGLVLSYALGLLAAAVHPEARPFTTHPQVHPLISHHPGQAFPSDHSTAAFGIALVVFAFLSRRVGAVLLAAAALIAFSRVYVGVHYPGDVVASLLVALLGVGLVALLRSRTRKAGSVGSRPGPSAVGSRGLR